MISAVSIESHLSNVTVYEYSKDKRHLDSRFGSRFAAFVSRLDARFSCDEVDACIGDTCDLASAYQVIRQRHVLYGSGYLLAGPSDPYLGLDVADAKAVIDLYLEQNFEMWVCDTGFNWCVELRSDGIVRLFRSPYSAIVTLLKHKASV